MNQEHVIGPDAYYCLISGELMQDPVIDPEGNTYDRKSIAEWLSKNQTSPVTRKPLDEDKLFPNRALKEAIEEWKAKVVADGKSFLPQVDPKAFAESKVKVQVEAFPRKSAKGTHDVIVSLDGGAGAERTPVDIVCVIDISGSMQTEVTSSNADGVSESNGLSILDVVKHAVSTIIHTLNANDRIALVSYSDSARVELELQKCDKAGQNTADSILKKLHTEGSTNLWDGILKGMDVCKKSKRDGQTPAVFVLTDGMPNVRPPRGELAMLQRYKEENQLNYTINTFGFGYSLDSVLLNELAVEGGGAFSFIPEAGFVGTCFVNAMSNLLSCCGTDASLSIEHLNGSKIVQAFGGLPSQSASWGEKLSLGSLNYGQKRSVVLRMTLPETGGDFANVTLQYALPGAQAKMACVEATASLRATAVSEESIYQYSRAIAVDAISTMVKSGDLAEMSVRHAKVLEAIKKEGHGSKNLTALLKDLEGQVSEAISRQDWYRKWGRHYLPSLARAHALQFCNNFKDPGVQVYGGPLFEKIRDIADAVFLKLPPPKPSVKKRDGSSYKAPASMSAYYDCDAVCFSGESLVTMADGSLRRCSALRPGDQVLGGATIKCVVRTECLGGKQSLVRLSATMRATPWHPVQFHGKWTFPCHVGKVEEQALDATWNFVLDRGHEMEIGGIKCATLGHGIVNDPSDIRSSEYWGREVLRDLAEMEGYDEGFISIKAPKIVRSHETGLVTKLISVEL